MDWKHNTIWFDQIEQSRLLSIDFQGGIREKIDLKGIEYLMTFYFKHKGNPFSVFQSPEELLYLELNLSSIKDFSGIENFPNLRRLETELCSKLESEAGISALKDTLEFLHINNSKKYSPTNELYQLKNLKVLRLTTCGPLEDLSFLHEFPHLIEFGFVQTNVLNGDLSPLLEHPTLRRAAFLDRRHYSHKFEQIDKVLESRSPGVFKETVYDGTYSTFIYKAFLGES